MKTRLVFSGARRPSTRVVVLALSLGVAACDSATVGASPGRHAEPRRTATPTVPQPAIGTFSEEYAEAHRRLSTAPVEPMAPTF